MTLTSCFFLCNANLYFNCITNVCYGLLSEINYLILSYVMHWTCYKNHVRSMTMDIRFELRIRDQIVTSVSFDIKTGIPPPPPPICWHFEDDCVPNGSTGKVAPWGVLLYS